MLVIDAEDRDHGAITPGTGECGRDKATHLPDVVLLQEGTNTFLYGTGNGEITRIRYSPFTDSPQTHDQFFIPSSRVSCMQHTAHPCVHE